MKRLIQLLAIVVGTCCVWNVGCARYERRPIDVAALSKDWAEQPLDVESVRDYMAALAGHSDSNAPPTFNAEDGFTLAEAEAVALHFNPRLRQMRAEAGVPLATARESGWWPDPQFQASVLSFVNRGRPTRFKLDGGSFDGVNTGVIGPGGFSASGIEQTPPGLRRVEGNSIADPWIIDASLSITLPISGRLAVEQDVRWAEYDATWRSIAISEWKLLVNLRSKWLAWSVTQRRLQVSREYAGRIDAASKIAERLSSVGELKTTDARVLEIESARLRASIQALTNQSAQQRLSLLALMGIVPDAPVRLIDEVFQSRVGVAKNQRRGVLLAHHPQVLATQAAYEVAEQALRLEVRKQFPDLNLGPSFSFEEGFSRAGLGVGLPLPMWNHNRQAVAEAFAERDAARSRAETVVQRVVAELAQSETRLAFADERLALLESELAPLVDKQIEETRTLLDLGEVDVLVLREALRASLETKLDILDATLARAQAANELQQMLAPRWVASAGAEGERE